MQQHSALIPYQIVMSLTIYAISMPHHHIQIRLQKAKKQPPSYPWILPRNSWFSCQKVHRRLQICFCKCLTFWKAINRNYSCLFPNVPTNETSFIKWLQKYQKSLISCEIRLLMELLGRFELPTSSLPRMRSTDWAIAALATQIRLELTTSSVTGWRSNQLNYWALWQGQKGSNPRHAVLETAALPAELYPYTAFLFLTRLFFCWWAFGDSNPGPTGYEPVALTNWAKGP